MSAPSHRGMTAWPGFQTGQVGKADGPERQDELERAREQLVKLRRLLAEGREGASREWVAAVEEAIGRASSEVVRAGGDPDDSQAPRPDQRGEDTYGDGQDGFHRLTS